MHPRAFRKSRYFLIIIGVIGAAWLGGAGFAPAVPASASEAEPACNDADRRPATAVFKTLLIVIKNTDIPQKTTQNHDLAPFPGARSSMPPEKIDQALRAYGQFGDWVERVSCGQARIDASAVVSEVPLKDVQLRRTRSGQSDLLRVEAVPKDFAPWFDRYHAASYDSVFVWVNVADARGNYLPLVNQGATYSPRLPGLGPISVLYGARFDLDIVRWQVFAHEFAHQLEMFYKPFRDVALPYCAIDSKKAPPVHCQDAFGYRPDADVPKGAPRQWSQWLRDYYAKKIWDQASQQFVGLGPTAWNHGTRLQPR
jgi:hypothetical protein